MDLLTSPKDTAENDLLRYADDRPFRRLGYLIVIIVFVFFGGWSLLAPLSSAALAPGTVTVEVYRKTVQHLEGGIVKAIHVRDGDTIKKGQVLVELEDTSSHAQLETLRGQLFFALAREARLKAERDSKATTHYPEILTTVIETDSRAQEAIRVQDQAFSTRKRSRSGEIGILKEQRQQLLSKIEGIKAQRDSRSNLSESLKKELSVLQAMLKEGYVEKQKISEMERRLEEYEGDLGDFIANITTAQTQISEIELKILQIEKEFQREVIEELSKAQSEVAELREKIQWLDDTVARTIIKSPSSGMVLGLTIHTVGAVIAPGGKLLDIVPQQEKLVIEAQVSPNDIDRVSIGQICEIRFSAFKSAKTPKISGRLTTLSADRIIDEQNKTSHYLARIEVDKNGLNELQKLGLTLLPGMPTEVLINTGERTFFQYMMQPISDIFARSLIED